MELNDEPSDDPKKTDNPSGTSIHVWVTGFGCSPHAARFVSLVLRCGERCSGDTEEVFVEDPFHIASRVAFCAEKWSQLLEVRDGVEVLGCLFDPECAIEIGADPAVARGSCHLADMVDVLDRG